MAAFAESAFLVVSTAALVVSTAALVVSAETAAFVVSAAVEVDSPALLQAAKAPKAKITNTFFIR